MLICCKKCTKGIIAKLVSDKMLLFTKRQSDYHPIRINIFGKDFAINIDCTLCGETQFIECVDGVINKESLLLKENDNGQRPPEGSPTDEKDGEGNPIDKAIPAATV